MKLVINITAFLVFVLVLYRYPPDKGFAQHPRAVIEKPKGIDTMAVISDSLVLAGDSIQNRVAGYATKSEKTSKSIPSKLSKLSEGVQALIDQNKVSERVVYRTRDVSAPVDKDYYFLRQRIYTDSLAEAKRDSIRWENRGLLRKIFGTGRKYMK